ncbi:hypothetical protein BS636_12525 [Acinetobacter sp. LoGeW2-3]|uniref:hypothetical protein n=1 Tax=Acinetobacter sp. LoGeW2-3 TaxID=1808001 RepID=UPI000C05CBD9|nr:hypothetical protein [Acinetobacter sp. LoGeW2-3]ATO20431.1 hypothetical protein BS636_12525 [Acinetobacter sp. LoGeW2-3]
MQKQLAIISLALVLNACGDGNDDIFRGVDGSSSSRLMGIYNGSLTDGNLSQRSILGVIEKNSNFWLLYSPPGSDGYTGIMHGRFSLSGNTVSASDIRDYNFALNQIASVALNGTYTADRNLQGNLNNVANQPFNLIYNVNFSRDNTSISSLVGSYSGRTTTLSNDVVTAVNISSSGVITGTVGNQEPCAFAGRVSTENNAPYYTINLVFTDSASSSCLNGTQEVNGILLSQSQQERQTIYILAENTDQRDAVLFIGE